MTRNKLAQSGKLGYFKGNIGISANLIIDQLKELNIPDTTRLYYPTVILHIFNQGFKSFNPG